MSAPARLVVLRVVLTAVIVAQSVGAVVAPGEVARGHLAALAGFVRVLAAVEVLAALLLLPPRTARLGGWLLLAVLGTAIAVHALHGQFQFAWLVLAAAATWAVQPPSGARAAPRPGK